MSKPIIFGEIEGLKEGYRFEKRNEMLPTSFHRSLQAGIDGNRREGASAIVLSGGYEDDTDYGDEIIYTGAGGNDPSTRKQIKDQSWETSGNAGLLTSMDQGLPVRVIRGFNHKSQFSPDKGYVYGGLYSVVDAWQEIGKSGFKICRFRLKYSGNNYNHKTPEQDEIQFIKLNKERKETIVLRIIRDTKIALEIKKLYNFKCQICQISIPTKLGHYAEGAHIKPLGMPHNGDDLKSNILCLCPNHHVMLDKGSLSIQDDFQLIGVENGKLIVHPEHKINVSNLQYHRKTYGHD